MQGKIRKLVSERGFGFIQEGRHDRFFHAAKTTDFDTLTVGQLVEYTPIESPKGHQAENVRAVDR